MPYRQRLRKLYSELTGAINKGLLVTAKSYHMELEGYILALYDTGTINFKRYTDYIYLFHLKFAEVYNNEFKRL